MHNGMSIPKEIPVSQLTGKQWKFIFWGFWWRSVCTLAVIALLAVTIYVLVTFFTIVAARVLVAYGVLSYVRDKTAIMIIKIIAAILIVPVGNYCFYLYIKWILNSHFGPLRLALVFRDDKIDTFSNVKL